MLAVRSLASWVARVLMVVHAGQMSQNVVCQGVECEEMDTVEVEWISGSIRIHQVRMD